MVVLVCAWGRGENDWVKHKSRRSTQDRGIIGALEGGKSSFLFWQTISRGPHALSRQVETGRSDLTSRRLIRHLPHVPSTADSSHLTLRRRQVRHPLRDGWGLDSSATLLDAGDDMCKMRKIAEIRNWLIHGMLESCLDDCSASHLVVVKNTGLGSPQTP